MRVLAALILIIGLSLPAMAQNYDRLFVQYTALHFGSLVSPKWIKSAAIAESNLNPNARSPVGAMGLMQFMPLTWKDESRGTPYSTASALDPEAAIYVGVKYRRRLWDRYPQSGPYQRKALADAAYNAGMGWIAKAQQACRTAPGCNPGIWDDPNVEAHLKTSPQSQVETRNYVRRIRAFELRIQIGM